MKVINRKRTMLGTALIKYRIDNQMSQKELAKKIGIHETAYSHYETGNRIPSLRVLEKILKVCEFDIKMITDDVLMKHIKGFCYYVLINTESTKIDINDLLTIYKILAKYKKQKIGIVKQ